MQVKMQVFSGGLLGWNALIKRLPGAHLLQSWEWAQVKAGYGWEPTPYTWGMTGDLAQPLAAAMVLKKRLIRHAFAAPLGILYVPKGPLLDWTNEDLRTRVLDDLQRLAKREGAIFLKLDPDIILGTGIPGQEAEAETEIGRQIEHDLRTRGWRFASDQIQFRNTVQIDLTIPEAELLRRMNQKMRYNIRLAGKKGVSIREAQVDDLALLYRMYAETSTRDGFVIREEAYYRRVWSTFLGNREVGLDPSAEALIAEVEGDAVAALFLFQFGRRAYYLYGMSREVHRERMPNHLLQWEAIRRAQARGCEVYDLWGAPDKFNPEDALWGVFRFKQGLGGQVIRTLGAWDYPASRFWYSTYTGIIPRLLDVMRKRGRVKTRAELAAA